MSGHDEYDVDPRADWHTDERAGSAGSTGVAGLPDGGAGTGSTRSTGVAGLLETGKQTGEGKPARILDEVRDWLARFICVVDDTDLDLLALWAAHSHLVVELYTSPRLILDSPVPGSGKTTTLEHLERLCQHPVQMASVSSPALLTRMLDAGMRTILIDEADRSLDPKREGVGELIAVLNSGYKRGGTRPVLIPTKDGWAVNEMPTYAPVVMAGNNPSLPEDTRSRSIRVLLMPDIDGTAEDSDWELIDAEARALGKRLATWAEGVSGQITATRPVLPEVVKGRARERWLPLLRIAVAAGGHWAEVVADLAVKDVDRLTAEREEGIVQERPAVQLLRHINEVWGDGEKFLATDVLIDRLIREHPEAWGSQSPFGKAITPQRMGRMLTTAFNVHSDRPDGRRGYLRVNLDSALRRFGMVPRKQTGDSGNSGGTGGTRIQAGPICTDCSAPTDLGADGRPRQCFRCSLAAASAVAS